jgi:predicted ATP-grasp superfamily ATP-dependent carboligase
MNVLITNANSRMALCLARSGAKKGHSIIAADYIPHSMTFFSKYVSKKFLYPSPYSAPNDFLCTIKEKIAQYGIDVLIPIHEETFLMAKHAGELQEMTHVAVPDYKAILLVHGKDSLYELLKSLHILTPKTIPLSQISHYEEVRDLFPGRVALKPRQGGGNWGIHALDPGENYKPQIENYLESNGIDKNRILLQEWIPIDKKYSHVVIYQNGEMVQDFADIHLRDFPLGGGAGCLRVTCDPGPMTDISKRLFNQLGWHGIAEVEYVTHAETGAYYLIEINPRVWGGVNSAITSGLDIAEILICVALGKQVEPAIYKRGIQTRWFWADIRVLPNYFRHSTSKTRAIFDYLKLMFDDTKTDEFYWDDTIPFFVWPAHALFKMIRSRSLKPVAYDSLAGEWE